MKRIFACAGVAALSAISVAAQDSQDDKARADKVKTEIQMLLEKSKVVAAAGGVMGRTVKGAPYSGLEINESTQMLADGTRIHNEARTTVYRDADGRVRRETGDFINIWDPVANVSYALDSKTMTAHKATMAPAVFMRQVAGGGMGVGVGGGTSAGGGGGYSTGYAVGTASAGGFAGAGSAANVSVQDGMIMVVRDGKTEKFPVPADGNWTSDDGKIHAVIKQTTDAARAQHTNFTVNQGQLTVSENGQTHTMPMPTAVGTWNVAMPLTATMVGGQLTAESKMRMAGKPAKMEQLGEETVEGVKSRGTRTTNTIDAGEIGNDRALTMVAERWYSDELQTEIVNRRTDPRTGENSFRLTNINRSEPPAYLFQVPSGYNLIERK